jgi:3-oxoacyl-[acyl-carrier-protein] synthase II
LGILSKCREGTASYRPFDRNRDGFIAGEGGASILLESYEGAKQRGAEILGTIKGFGNCVEFSTDRSLSVPARISLRNINLALNEAQSDLRDVAFITPHGSGTVKGDRSEMMSLLDLLDTMKHEIPICGLKPYTGHMGAASDIAEVILGIKSVVNRTVPATLNFQGTEEKFSGLRISGKQQECSKKSFVSVSYGIGGQSSSVVVSVG